MMARRSSSLTSHTSHAACSAKLPACVGSETTQLDEMLALKPALVVPGQHAAQHHEIRARAALPYLLAGLQISAPAAILGAMVGEFTGAERGLGVLTIRFTRDLDVPALWAVAALAAGLSMGQLLSLPMIAIGLWLALRAGRPGPA